ncbi:LysM peptidoglycan-binding domain-containing protein [Rubrobacter marinus]|uniref:LysM peptidoglycan-binding domain-containing protein n=1 Tax=Rubrobacter marinus TaxID=2653852 RepID=A0A6G8Q214_9ACTN|nr:LysM peptidoglycan-binding domain-containing protein [Rubrobacter marinus]QIN80521.1 LysM peptidoglycan-binding domain-containing protein [Rubrobacter marinus]
MKSARSTYRRRRLGALFVATAAVFALYTGTGAGAGTQPVRYTVSPGDTLWDIAVAHTPSREDPRPVVEIIKEANDLSGTRIHPGMTLELPPVE